MSTSDARGKTCVRMQNALLVDSTLMSFTAGFKLAWGIARELETDGLYSFEKEDEESISEVNTDG